MAILNPSARLKVNRDTYYFPDSYEGVYFRNNVNSFRMEGGSIEQWVEKLVPAFNGSVSLGELTEGLPDPYRNRVYEIAEVLYGNGFVRDVSQDNPHQLPEGVLSKYASQIEFLDSFGGSGASRFQTYRQTKVLAVGSGSFLLSLASALLESGLPKFHMLITDTESVNRKRLMELEAHAHKTDQEVAVTEIKLDLEDRHSLQETVRLFDAVLYVSHDGDLEELSAVHTACRNEKKIFVPAVHVLQTGMAGPLVHPDSEGCWESAWRRVHRSRLCQDPEQHTFSSTAGAMLANVIVFEWFKHVTGVTEAEQLNRFFLLNLETLEGDWHSFLPHPQVTGRAGAQWVNDFESWLQHRPESSSPERLLTLFGGLTSAVSGIFHVWEEGDLKQLPLSQCRVQAVNPLPSGPVDLLPDIICCELTHEKARREAGLTGIEAYASMLAASLIAALPSNRETGSAGGQDAFVGVGAGETVAECICRGLQKCLEEELHKRSSVQPLSRRVRLDQVEDNRCRYYLQALTTMQGEPVIAVGEATSGFPVVWVGSGGRWKGCVGLNTTIALRNALAQTLMQLQNQSAIDTTRVNETSSVFLESKAPISLVIPVCDEASQPEVLLSALKVLKRNAKHLKIYEFTLEPVLHEEMAGVFGVVLQEGEYR